MATDDLNLAAKVAGWIGATFGGLSGIKAPTAWGAKPPPLGVHHNIEPSAFSSPRPVIDAAAALPAPSRPLEGLTIHDAPVEAYHGTLRDFSTFDKSRSQDFGIHAGTSQAASDRVSGTIGNGLVIPMQFGTRDRPFTSLEVPDLWSWEPRTLVRTLEGRGVRFTPEEFFGATSGPSSRKEKYAVIEDVLNKHNVDTLRYRNQSEDVGSTSWVTWNPDTLWSKTTGDRLYGLAPLAGAAAMPGVVLDRHYRDDSRQSQLDAIRE